MKIQYLLLSFSLFSVPLSYAQEQVEEIKEDVQNVVEEVTAEAEELTADVAAESEAVAEEVLSGSVERAIFTSAVQDREPIDQLTGVDTSLDKVYFFTELKGMEGQTVSHRWEYNGEQQAEVQINVGGPRWRVWTSKNITPEWIGTWKVSVINASGDVVHQEQFEYEAAKAEQINEQQNPDNPDA